MNYTQNRLAIRYADAFLNLFDTSITPENLQTFCRTAAFFDAHKRRLSLALTPYLDTAHAAARITDLCKQMGMPETCKQLVHLLAHANRLELLPTVLTHIGEQYKIRHGTFDCAIISSHPLSEQNKAALNRFLDHATNHTLMKQYSVDKSLIAGIRVVGDNLFWEYSIRRYLAEISRKVIR